ncbi:MAG: JAB domain-containing protein [Acidimicrobiia bacterium]
MGAVKRQSGLSGPVRGPADVVRFVQAALGTWYASHAAVVVIGLDAASRVTGLAENRQRWTPRSLTVREMVDLSAELAARAVVLVQLVPNLRREPSIADAQSFRTLATKCASEGVQILDCVVVSGQRWWSLGRLLSERAASN